MRKLILSLMFAVALVGCGPQKLPEVKPAVKEAAVVKTIEVKDPATLKDLGESLRAINANVITANELRFKLAQTEAKLEATEKAYAQYREQVEPSFLESVVKGVAWLFVALAGLFFFLSLSIPSFPKWISGAVALLSIFGLGLVYVASEAVQHWFVVPVAMLVACACGYAYFVLHRHGKQCAFVDRAFNEVVQGGEAFKEAIEQSGKDGSLTIAEVKAAFRSAQRASQSRDVQEVVASKS